MPRAMAGVKPWKGKKKPVMLVAAVAARKSAVERGRSREVRRPQRTAKPAAMAARLRRTWKRVKAVRSMGRGPFGAQGNRWLREGRSSRGGSTGGGAARGTESPHHCHPPRGGASVREAKGPPGGERAAPAPP